MSQRRKKLIMSIRTISDEAEVSWQVDDIEVNASLSLPEGEGPFPAVIMVAGSGPTDRNWNSPMIPGTNGSGALLARILTDLGYVTLRYDKRASGPHGKENAIKLLGKVSLQGHLDELAGGVQMLTKRKEVELQSHFCPYEQRRMHPCPELSNSGPKPTFCRSCINVGSSPSGGDSRKRSNRGSTERCSGRRPMVGSL